MFRQLNPLKLVWLNLDTLPSRSWLAATDLCLRFLGKWLGRRSMDSLEKFEDEQPSERDFRAEERFL